MHHQDIDLSRYVALGDSITAGYADGALYHEGQLHAYAAIMAQQFAEAGGGLFRQPLMPVESPGVNLDGESRLVLVPGNNPKDYVLTHAQPQGDLAAFSQNNYVTQGPYHNMGVPGAKVITAIMPGFGNPANGAGNYNPFFTRMASNMQTASMLSDALLLNPSFFSLYIGNNDALAYALSGGTQNAITPLHGPMGMGFDDSFSAIVNALTSKGAKGVVANLPSVSQVPYFNAIAPNGLLLNGTEAVQLNDLYKSSGITFREGENNFVIADASVKPQGIRLIEKNELILLDVILDRDKHAYLKGEKPIPEKYTLSHERWASVEKAIDGYNSVIRAVASEKHLAFVDINSLLKTAKPDRFFNPATLNIDHMRRGVFSLDGLHPNAFGQSLIANEFIRSINTTFHCELPFVKSSRFKGIVFP